MRSLVLLFLGAISAVSQPFSFGVKGGVPLTDFVDTLQNGGTVQPLRSASDTKRYIVGPTVELHLPAGFGVELDALFRHFNYQTAILRFDTNIRPGSNGTTATSNVWEFPLLLKYRFPTKVIRPYVAGGAAWDRLQGLSATVTRLTTPLATTTQTSTPPELQNSTTRGAVIGAGVDVHVLVIHLSPEIRYTRWTSQHFTFLSFLGSNQNQAEFLLGITF